MSKHVFEQGALDSLHAAKRAVERAIAYYEQCKTTTVQLDTQDGPLFAMRDNAKTARQELACALSLAINRPKEDK